MKDIENALANADPRIGECFLIPKLLDGLREKLSDQEIADMITNSSGFQEILDEERDKRHLGDLSGLFGEVVYIPEGIHGDGSVRRAEEGYRINVDYLKKIGIDSKKVLYFRRTQPSKTPKHEYYWTSSFSEVLNGLRKEIPERLRSTSIILVSNLDLINQNEGLMHDINDDSGLPVRQIGLAPFNQNKTITKLK